MDLAPQTRDLALAAARAAIDQFHLELVRIWLVDRENAPHVELAADASASPQQQYGGLPAARVELAMESRTPLLHAKPERSARDGDIPSGAFLGLPLLDGDELLGFAECYSNGALSFSDAAGIEMWARELCTTVVSAMATSSMQQSASGHILLADDDAAIRKLLETLLTRNGFQVTAVANGQLAFEAATERRPDLILLDWMMPILDGRTAAERMKHDERTRDIPIVMLTSQSRTEDKVAALEAGAQDYLTKPFDSRELVARISQQLRWRKLLASDPEVETGNTANVGSTVPAESPIIGAPATSQTPAASKSDVAVSVMPPADGDYWNAAVQAQQLGKSREALAHYVAEAERCENSKQYPRAAIAFRSASAVAGQLQNLDLSNKFLRLAGKMYLSWAESTHDAKAIADAYVNAARCFLSAGNLKLAKKSVEIAESMQAVMADDRPGAL